MKTDALSHLTRQSTGQKCPYMNTTHSNMNGISIKRNTVVFDTKLNYLHMGICLSGQMNCVCRRACISYHFRECLKHHLGIYEKVVDDRNCRDSKCARKAFQTFKDVRIKKRIPCHHEIIKVESFCWKNPL